MRHLYSALGVNGCSLMKIARDSYVGRDRVGRGTGSKLVCNEHVSGTTIMPSSIDTSPNGTRTSITNALY